MSEKNDRTLKDRIKLHFSIYRAVYGALIILGFILIDWALYPEVFKALHFAVLFFLFLIHHLWCQARNYSYFHKQARKAEVGEDRMPDVETNPKPSEDSKSKNEMFFLNRLIRL